MFNKNWLWIVLGLLVPIQIFAELLYIPLLEDPGKVVIVDTATDTILSNITLAASPRIIAYCVATKRAYVVHQQGLISIINTDTHTVLDSFYPPLFYSLLNPKSISISKDGSILSIAALGL